MKTCHRCLRAWSLAVALTTFLVAGEHGKADVLADEYCDDVNGSLHGANSGTL